MSFTQYLALIDLRLRSEMALEEAEHSVNVGGLTVTRQRRLVLLNSVLDTLIHRYRVS